MTNPGLLLIRGLGHSGSTLLDLVLGAHPKVVGVGEAVRVLTANHIKVSANPDNLIATYPCTCGESVRECSVWGRFVQPAYCNVNFTLEEKLEQLITRVCENHRSVRWIVESYQSDEELLQLQSLKYPVKVIHLARDVRSWVHSEARRGVTRYGRGSLAGWRGLIRWWRINSRTESIIRGNSLWSFNLGYEELALAPEKALRLLCDWLELDFDPKMLLPGAYSKSHIIAGNRMRYDSERRDKIVYDGAWLNSSAASVQSSILFPPIKSLNKKLVYSNEILGSVWPRI